MVTNRPVPDDGLPEFARVLDAIMTERRIDAAELSRRLGSRGQRVSPAALRSWRTGRRQPEHQASLEAIDAIEELLGLAPARLRRSLQPSRRPGPRPPRQLLGEQVDQPALMAALYEKVGLSVEPGFVLSSTQHILEVGTDRRPTLLTIFATIRAVRPLDRVPLVVTSADPNHPLRAEALVGGRLTASTRDMEHGIFVWVFELDRPLQLGELALIGTRTDWSPGEPEADSYRIYLEDRASSVSLGVRFAEPAIPRSAVAFTAFDGGETPAPVIRANLTHAWHRTGPGSVGLRWDW